MESIIGKLSENYPNNGYFVLANDQNLSLECNAPEEPGVYCIFKIWKDKKELVYIGASGTMKQNGEFKNQLLCGRINATQDGMPQQHYFAGQFLRNSIEKFEICWFVTFDEHSNHLPKYVEGVLLQKYFELNGVLPIWNKSF